MHFDIEFLDPSAMSYDRIILTVCFINRFNFLVSHKNVGTKLDGIQITPPLIATAIACARLETFKSVYISVK